MFVYRTKCTVIVRIMDFVTVLLQSQESVKVLLITFLGYCCRWEVFNYLTASANLPAEMLNRSKALLF